MSNPVGQSTAQDRRKRRHNLNGSAYNWEREETRAQSGPLGIQARLNSCHQEVTIAMGKEAGEKPEKSPT